MRDPHVQSLRYRLEVDEVYGRFENPPPLESETDAYRLRLENGVLTVELKEHHTTAESARRRVDPDLRAWELDAALTRDHDWIKFSYDPSGTTIIDRNPPPAVPGHITATASVTLGGFSMTATATVVPPAFKRYPEPPALFEASPEVEVMFLRYQKAVWIDESQLLSVGYVCLTLLEAPTDPDGKRSSRNLAADKYRIDRSVLNKLGHIVSTRGDIGEARKLDAGATRTPLSQNERLWVRAATKALIRRKAEYDRDPVAAASLPLVTMTDLPAL